MIGVIGVIGLYGGLSAGDQILSVLSVVAVSVGGISSLFRCGLRRAQSSRCAVLGTL